MLNSSAGEVGTLLMIIFFPSVEPIPIAARDLISDLTDPVSEKAGFEELSDLMDLGKDCSPLSSKLNLKASVPLSRPGSTGIPTEFGSPNKRKN